jgi:hypothetical protein
MPGRLGPIKRTDFVARLRALGFEGPVAGTNHDIMVFGRRRLAIPSDAEYSVDLQRRMIAEISTILGRPVSRDEWIALRRRR